MNKTTTAIILILSLFFFLHYSEEYYTAFHCHQSLSIFRTEKIVAENGAVVSAHPLASKVGVEILKMGGNAIDAAIATQLALAVVYPNAGNLGGGGFTVARLSNGELISIDYREKAPDFQPVTCMWMQMEQQEQIKARMAI